MQQKRKAEESAAPELLWDTLVVVVGSLASTEVREVWAVPAIGPYGELNTLHFCHSKGKGNNPFSTVREARDELQTAAWKAQYRW